MSRRKVASDIFEQGLISSKSIGKFLRSTSHDARTRASTQRTFRELSEGRTNKEIGQQLGISYQRVTSLKKQIQEGRAYSPELRDLLRTASKEYNATPQKLEEGVYYFPDKSKLEKTTKLDVIKTFPAKSDARNYWKRIINSGRYIAIVRNKVRGRDKKIHDFYQVVGFGKRTQRPQKGIGIQDKRAKNRVDQLIAKIKK